jgi:hypothetical protein
MHLLGQTERESGDGYCDTPSPCNSSAQESPKLVPDTGPTVDHKPIQPWKTFLSEPVVKPVDPCKTGRVRWVAEACAIGSGGG